jgi:hypothetical protein
MAVRPRWTVRPYGTSPISTNNTMISAVKNWPIASAAKS